MLVLAASEHRQAAFEAASFLMDYLKTRAPFWKKEHRADGSEGDWVAAKEKDDTRRGEVESASRASPCSARASPPASPPSSQLIWSRIISPIEGSVARSMWFARIPELRAHQRLAAMEVGLLDRDADDSDRQASVDRSERPELRVGVDRRAAVDAQRLVHARHEEEHPDAAVLENVFERIEAVVAGKIRDHQRRRIERLDEARRPAAR